MKYNAESVKRNNYHKPLMVLMQFGSQMSSLNVKTFSENYILPFKI